MPHCTQQELLVSKHSYSRFTLFQSKHQKKSEADVVYQISEKGVKNDFGASEGGGLRQDLQPVSKSSFGSIGNGTGKKAIPFKSMFEYICFSASSPVKELPFQLSKEMCVLVVAYLVNTHTGTSDLFFTVITVCKTNEATPFLNGFSASKRWLAIIMCSCKCQCKVCMLLLGPEGIMTWNMKQNWRKKNVPLLRVRLLSLIFLFHILLNQ